MTDTIRIRELKSLNAVEDSSALKYDEVTLDAFAWRVVASVARFKRNIFDSTVNTETDFYNEYILKPQLRWLVPPNMSDLDYVEWFESSLRIYALNIKEDVLYEEFRLTLLDHGYEMSSTLCEHLITIIKTSNILKLNDGKFEVNGDIAYNLYRYTEQMVYRVKSKVGINIISMKPPMWEVKGDEDNYHLLNLIKESKQ